jgi:hypothetical protein
VRKVTVGFGLLCFCAIAIAQSSSSGSSDEALLDKTRNLYDAPFKRNLISFDCAVQFDWKEHFLEFTKVIPPDALQTAERLQSVQHRIFVDRSGAVVSSVPKRPDFSDAPKAAQLERVFDGMVSGGVSAWLPSSMGEILPVAPTKYAFERIDSGYRLTMNGAGVAATLLLNPDLRVTSGVVQLPQPMRFITDFASGPSGYVLQSVKTGSTSDPTAAGEAGFAYTYQSVQGFQLPALVNVTPSTTEPWHYELSDCKVVAGIVIKVAPPPKP